MLRADRRGIEQRKRPAELAEQPTMTFAHSPAMAVPCGLSDGLPVSLMLVAKHFDEPAIYKAAFAFEQAGD